MVWISEVRLHTCYVDVVASPMFQASASLKKMEIRRIIFCRNSDLFHTYFIIVWDFVRDNI